MRLHLFDDTTMERIEEHDVDDPDNGVHDLLTTHVLLSVAEQRARDEAIILAACSWGYRPVWRPSPEQIDAIIATTEQETP